MSVRPWLSALSAGVWLSAAALAQPNVIHVDVNLVRVLATVKDPSGQLIGTLNKGDFTISDNGAPQEVAVFEHHTEQPLSIAILVDTSGSTAKELKYETDSMVRFLKALFSEGNPDDAVELYTFNYEIVRQNNFTHNASSIERSLRTLKGEAGTSMYDAIFWASKDLERRPGRKVIVMVTDGGDTTSSHDFHAAVSAAQLADAVIYPVLVVPIANEVGRNVGGENALTTMAQWTGGRVFAPTVGAALDQAFSDIIKELRTQYLLAFYPKNVPLTKDKFHKLEIKVRRPDLRVTARNGYYGESEAKSGDSRIPAVPEQSSRRKSDSQTRRQQERFTGSRNDF
jgi:Ca-activated chloride channel family protein